MFLLSSASLRDFASTSSGMTLRASIHPSVASASRALTRYQRSFFVLSLGSGISTVSRRSTVSPRLTSSRSAATTAVELRICALCETTTPVLLRLAIALHPVSATRQASAAKIFIEGNLDRSITISILPLSRHVIVTQLAQQIALLLRQLFANT